MRKQKYFSRDFLYQFLLLGFLLIHCPLGHTQSGGLTNDIQDDDLDGGSDIFSDFNEDILGAHMAEDERFYRYGRFFSFALALGLTSFDGNRGAAYENDPPSYGMGVYWFNDFQTSFGLGLEYSKHSMFIGEPVNNFRNNAVGFITISALRVFMAYRYYLDTANLGTAITYSNPYFAGRIEYWYLTNKYQDQSELPDDSGGGLGFAAGFGLEFPIKLRESYIGVELLYHTVNFYDKYTQKFAPINEGGYGYEDLTGNAYSTMISYVMSW
ncbi:MAG: hypothetical protein HYV97_11180 [Bdellovibrio sp.]|nr:hypothetical protein [Bdellovibrio sp.]